MVMACMHESARKVVRLSLETFLSGEGKINKFKLVKLMGLKL